jgi:hypothetical protein
LPALDATIGPLGGVWLYQTYGAAAPFYTNRILLALLAFLRPPADSHVP